MATAVRSANPGQLRGDLGFRLEMMFHTSHRVPDLRQAERWIARVLGRPSMRLETVLDLPENPVDRNDYASFTMLRDLNFETLDPRCYIKEGMQRFPIADRPRLNGFGWYVDGIDELYRTLREHDFHIVDCRGMPARGEQPPTLDDGDLPVFLLDPEDAGLRYQFLPRRPYRCDPRVLPGWELPPVDDDDPLGLVRCAYHTVLTAEPKRAMRLFTDVLGGHVIHEGRDHVRGLDSIYIQLADGVYEFGVPDEGTPAYADRPPGAPRDTYHAITFQVRDLDQVARHLSRQGVRIQDRTEHCIVADPQTALGIPWGFVTALTPGDTRSA